MPKKNLKNVTEKKAKELWRCNNDILLHDTINSDKATINCMIMI